MTFPSQEKSTELLTTTASKAQFTSSYDSLFTEEAIYQAYLDARKGKRNKRYIQDFEMSLSKNLADLRQELITHTYKPRPCRHFEIWCTAGQKTREISAPNFRDLIAQFVVYNAIYPTFERTFIFDSYGCRRYKGSHRAANRVQDFIRHSSKNSYYLQLDIKKYYYNIDHAILQKALERVIVDKDIVSLIMLFVSDRAIGINVGSLIAQLLGLIYLNRFDHYIKRVLSIKRYVRYVDDMVLIGYSRLHCYSLFSIITTWLKTKLCLSLSHWKIEKLVHGINFCGYRTWHALRLIRKRSLGTFNRRIKSHNWQAIESLLAHAYNTASYTFFIKKLLQLNIDYPNHIQRRLNSWQYIHTSL